MRRKYVSLRFILFASSSLAFGGAGYGQDSNVKSRKGIAEASDVRQKQIILARNSLKQADAILPNLIGSADGSFSLDELTSIVNTSCKCCNASQSIGASLTKWLRENHPIYQGMRPTDANQFRGFLLASLASFPPSEELYTCIKSELLFGGHPFNIATAAVAARKFSNKSKELVALMVPYLHNSFQDTWIDITTPRLAYPIASPTKARYEILATLIDYGALALGSLTTIEEITASRNCDTNGLDSILCRKAAEAYSRIKGACDSAKSLTRKEAKIAIAQPGIELIDKRYRRTPSVSRLNMMDQNGTLLRFDDLKGRPFAITFFYTQCSNGLKCMSTINRLGLLQKECTKKNISDKVGLYAMTYDWDFDTPAVLKKYGQMYGFGFSRTMKFLKAVDNSGVAFSNALNLRVNYGAGTVNQHGIQLFIFDRNERLAAITDNDVWTVADVLRCLNALNKE